MPHHAASSSDRARRRAPSSTASDLAVARNLSRQLVGERDASGKPEAAAPALAFTPAQSWDALLEDCVRQVPAIAAFVVDERGLLVAAAGALAPGLLEATGAQLAVALRHLESLPVTTAVGKTVMVEYDGEWLTGLRLVQDGAVLLLGVLSDRPMSPTARGIVRAALAGTT